jgi:hypothetical protein
MQDSSSASKTSKRLTMYASPSRRLVHNQRRLVLERRVVLVNRLDTPKAATSGNAFDTFGWHPCCALAALWRSPRAGHGGRPLGPDCSPIRLGEK